MKIALLFLGLSLAAVAVEPPPAVAPPYYSMRCETSDKPGELAMPVPYTLWIPEGAQTLRG